MNKDLAQKIAIRNTKEVREKREKEEERLRIEATELRHRQKLLDDIIIFFRELPIGYYELPLGKVYNNKIDLYITFFSPHYKYLVIRRTPHPSASLGFTNKSRNDIKDAFDLILKPVNVYMSIEELESVKTSLHDIEDKLEELYT